MNSMIGGRRLKCYLLDVETSMVKMMRPAPGVINFFEVIDDFPESWLYNRLCDIYKLNPWLGGQLKQTDKGIALVFAEDSEFPGFKVVYNSGVSVKLSWDEIYAHPSILDMAAPKGSEALKTGVPMFKVTLFKEGTKEVVIGVSICHTLGDGRTLFQIMSMLDKDVEPFVLYPKRVKDFSHNIGEILGPEFNWHDSVVSMAGVVGNLIFRPLEAEHKMLYYEFDGESIEKEKEKYQQEDSYVSTNDIITSWIARETNCEFVLMMVDFRNRVEGVTLQHAGNYSHDVILDRNQFMNPAAVRNVVDDLNKRKTKKHVVPDVSASLNYNCMMLTSWVAFYHDLKVEGCVSMLQVPFWSREDIKRIPWRHCGCIFRPRAGELALNWASKTHATSENQRLVRYSSSIVRKENIAVPGKHNHYRVPTGTLRSLVSMQDARWITNQDSKMKSFLMERARFTENTTRSFSEGPSVAEIPLLTLSSVRAMQSDIDKSYDKGDRSGRSRQGDRSGRSRQGDRSGRSRQGDRSGRSRNAKSYREGEGDLIADLVKEADFGIAAT